MNLRNRALHPLLPLFALLVHGGCGSEGPWSETTAVQHPEGIASCETLAPLVLQDPRTGGAFHCFWCNREWKWTVPESHPSLFILVDVICECLGSEAHVEIRDPEGSVVWRREIRPGSGETHCIRYADPPSGTYSLRLYGRQAFLLMEELIEEFDGSLYLKLFNERGECIPPFQD